MKYKAINNALFVQNRKRFAAAMKPNSIALFISNAQISVSADALYPFKQNPDFFYLTGVDQEECALLLYPDAPDEKFKEVLFVRKTNETIAIWEGHKLNKEEATEASGIALVKWRSEFKKFISQIVHNADAIYLNSNEHTRKGTDFPYGDLLFINDIKTQFPLHELERAAPILGRLRSIKSDIEVDLIQKACNITAAGFERICKFVKPGVLEYEIEAEMIHEFIKSGANGFAYEPIIGSGHNACVLHYVDNNQICKDGDMLLMDFGANYANYTADLTRTIPVNGKFSDRQKEVYQAVLRVMKAATDMLVPGALLDEYHKQVGLIMQAELLQLGLITDKEIKEQDADKPAYKKYFMHGTSHHIGLDVHDVGNKYEAIQVGMVFTVEPGIYIPDESLGIRIENDVLVTNNKPKDLMANIPREVEAIEDFMNS